MAVRIVLLMTQGSPAESAGCVIDLLQSFWQREGVLMA